MLSGPVVAGLLIPFVGTTAGAACVFFMKRDFSRNVQRALTGFAAGVMVAASIWSLLIPAMEQVNRMGKWAFVPAVLGFWMGILFLLLLDHIIPHLHRHPDQEEGPKSSLTRSTMLVLAVTLHDGADAQSLEMIREAIERRNRELPGYKQVQDIQFSFAPFARTSTKKIIRKKVKEQYESEI